VTAPDAESARAAQSAECPGLSSSIEWDGAGSLRGEIYATERLIAHAAEIARSSGPTSLEVPAGRLLQRISAARKRIRAAYAVLARDGTRRRPSSSEEWLLDNSHIVSEQLREIEEDLPWGYLTKLPRFTEGTMRGYPRVYALCLDYLRHTDARLDTETLVQYVVSYQRVNPLSIGEIWAIPILLRLGLILTTGSIALGVAESMTREAEEPPAETPRRDHVRQASDQVTVANAITSMRTIAAFDWNKFFDRTSLVESILQRDPGGLYAASDEGTRDRYRHAIEELAEHSRVDECDVTNFALELAEAATHDAAEATWAGQVGYYLLGDGRPALEAAIGHRPTRHDRLVRAALGHPSGFYFGTIALLCVLSWCAWAFVVHRHAPPWLTVLLVVLSLAPVSELVIALVNALAVTLVPPRVLPKLSLLTGIGPERRTLVVIPSLLDGERVVDELLARLEVHALANSDEHVHYALLTDFPDATSETLDEDDALVERARRGIDKLNARHAGKEGNMFFLLHRRRLWNESQGVFMGWERKRGKLTELDRLLRGAKDTSFSVVTAPLALLESVRYVITLDADTELPRDTAKKLIGAISHPENRVRRDASGRIVGGYGVVQPRVRALPASSRRSRFARVMAGPPGIDAYTNTVSDVYQDVFGSGSYVGKAIYDVDAFREALDGRVPDNRLLSHDLFEGIFARTALASDIEVLDEQPSSYPALAARQHRWIRGDFQLIPWLFRRVPAADGTSIESDLPALGRWKLFDNLRRAFVAPSLAAIAIAGWLHSGTAALVTVAVLVVLTAPLYGRLAMSFFRTPAHRAFAVQPVVADLGTTAGQICLSAIFLLDQAFLAVDAIVRTAYRMVVSKANLLEWQTAGQAEQRLAGRIPARMVLSSCLALAVATYVLALSEPGAVFAAPLLACWLAAPLWAIAMSRPQPHKLVAALSPSDRAYLRRIALETWRFFETYVTEEDHFLPPDNYQEDPLGVVAHRTSPTNIGVYLLSVVAAHDLGFITLRDVVDKLNATLSTMDKLEKREGHILNWYDTTTLRPLEPRYVSTVDNGNLAAYLWTIREACTEFAREEHVDADLRDDLEKLANRVSAFADEMNFSFLYDQDRLLFSIGYNAQAERRDGNHYDLLASEARVASFIAIAKGEVAGKHWFRLGRSLAAVADGRALWSWSGSMFEYLMPLMVMRDGDETLLHETYLSVVDAHRRYGKKHGVPWGMSESLFNLMDLTLTYQYRAFGVPGLGLKKDLEEDVVVAPYATALAAMVRPDLAVENMKVLEAEGALGQFGFYEAIDYTPRRVPAGRRNVVVKAFMAHHQGMTLVALDNALENGRMQRRFHADPRVRATELLLEERVPVTTPLAELRPAPVAEPGVVDTEPEVVEHVALDAQGILRAHLLGQDDVSTIVTHFGTGVTTWRGLDVNRFREDATLRAGGVFVYVRDLRTGQTWSAGYEPTRKVPDSYDASFASHQVELRRRDGDVETLMSIVVSPDAPAEVRRITLTNHGQARKDLEITTFTEVVLAPRGADRAHRAFGSLFIETEALAKRGAVLAHRRPRGSSETAGWMAQLLTPEEGSWTDIDYDTSRAAFVGRGRDPSRPSALVGAPRLSKSVGAVLDPAIALRRTISLKPGKSARVALTTILATSRAAVARMLEQFSDPAAIERTFDLSRVDTRVELRHLGITSEEATLYQRFLSALVFSNPRLRSGGGLHVDGARGRNALYAQGLSGDLPIVVFRLDDPEFTELAEDLLRAHEFFRMKGFPVDLVFLNEEPSGYFHPREDQARDIVQASIARGSLDRSGGVTIRRADQISEADRTVLFRAAHAVLSASKGPLSRQLQHAADRFSLPERLRPPQKPVADVQSEALSLLPFEFDNGFGGFDPQSDEYVIRVAPGKRPGAPWCNVIANPGFGFVVSEGGASCTWSRNSQSHRLTPWSNDPVCDPSGEVVYVRDGEDGAVWSATPSPAGGAARYTVRHGFGYTVFEHERRDLRHELTMFVDKERPAKVCRLSIQNRSSRTRTLRVFGAVEWVLGGVRDRSALTVSTEWDRSISGILAMNPLAAHWGRCAFFRSTSNVTSFTADRTELYGRSGSPERPAALRRVALAGRTGAGLDPCAALEVAVELPPGEQAVVSFVLGDGADRREAYELASAFAEPGAVDEALESVKKFWTDVLDVVRVSTPDPAFDRLVNGWLLYQAASCRLFGRTGFYQASGAYGFRDQLQDVLSLLHARPDLTREHLLRAAARQFSEGDVQHWWHPDTGEGIRTRCSDDMLWLPYVVAKYVRTTGDTGVLDEVVPFLDEKPLAETEVESFGKPAISTESATLYEHCVRAIKVGTTRGPHGLPKMRGGDWNDGMNRVGGIDGGESVWLAWFLARTLEDFSVCADARRDTARAAEWRAEVERLARAAADSAWDGEWYLRGYFEDGSPLGSQQDQECRIDAIAQSWAVLSGIAEPARAQRALDSAEAQLVDERHRLMALLWPPFQEPAQDPGYIRAYPPGVRENGGQYTHGVLWTVLARTVLGHGDRAFELFSLLNPIHQGTRDTVSKYLVEPYVLAGDIYSASAHAGRGGWTWYSGAAGWMYRIAVESILGICREGNSLRFSPCVPRHFAKYDVVYRFGGATYHIAVKNRGGASSQVGRIVVDGRDVSAAGRVELVDDGEHHDVQVLLEPSSAAPIARAREEARPAAPVSPHWGAAAQNQRTDGANGRRRDGRG
jgi:cyclic beta-1,2-glucan synthetase